MKKSMILSAILAGSLMSGSMFAVATAEEGGSINPLAALSAMGPVLKDVNNLQKAYQDAVAGINAGGKAFNTAKNKGNKAEQARGAIKIINNGLDPLSKLVALFTSLSNAIVALNMSPRVSTPVKDKILPNLIKAADTIKQMIDTMDLLTQLIPEEKPAAPAEVALEEAVFE